MSAEWIEASGTLTLILNDQAAIVGKEFPGGHADQPEQRRQTAWQYYIPGKVT
jgi:hypothetical protein